MDGRKIPFTLSLSKGTSAALSEGFDKLSPNGTLSLWPNGGCAC